MQGFWNDFKDSEKFLPLTDRFALVTLRGNDLHLTRSRLVQQVLEQLESTQVVVVSGAAGSGKSVVAKDALGVLATDHFVFSFRAEEFAQPHFDETLQACHPRQGSADSVVGATLPSRE